MDLRQLEMFMAIVEQGGFNKASASLHVSESAISRKISLLEAELGEKLFLRIGNRVKLTRAGEALAPHCRFISHRLDTAKTEIRDLAKLQHGELSIGAGMTACAYLLPPALKKFRAAFPGVEVRIATGTTSELLSRIKADRLDLGILTLPVKGNEFSATRLCAEELVVVVSPDHRWRKRRTLRAKELADFPLIVYDKEAYLRHILDAVFEELDVTPQIAMELPNFATIKPLVEINLGVSILPLSSVATEASDNRLHILRLKERRLERELGLVHLKTDPLPRAVSEIIRFFKEEIRNDRGTRRSDLLRNLPPAAPKSRRLPPQVASVRPLAQPADIFSGERERKSPQSSGNLGLDKRRRRHLEGLPIIKPACRLKLCAQ